MPIPIPDAVAAVLVDLAEDAAHRRYRTLMLADEASAGQEALADALRSPGLSVRAGTCGDEPNEVCVEAYGRDHLGRVWPSTPVIMLDPEWDRDADMARSLADDVVEHWERLRDAAQVAA